MSLALKEKEDSNVVRMSQCAGDRTQEGAIVYKTDAIVVVALQVSRVM